MKRVLLKLSGEALAGEKHTGFDEATCLEVAEQVKKLTIRRAWRKVKRRAENSLHASCKRGAYFAVALYRDTVIVNLYTNTYDT